MEKNEGEEIQYEPDKADVINDDMTLEVVVEDLSYNNGGNKLHKLCKGLLKGFLGLYIIGMIVGINELILSIANPYIVKALESQFMTANLVSWADFVVGPIRFIVSLLIWFTPMIALTFIVLKILSRVKFVSSNEFKVFKYVLFIILILVV